MTLFIIIVTLTAIVAVYALWARNWLKSKPWAAGFFRAAEPVEIALWRKSETILWARFLQALGIVLTLLASIGQFDLTPLMVFLPEEYRWMSSLVPLVVSMAGAANESLRKMTTKPIEIVELPDAMPPNVAHAVAVAEHTKQIAVATVANSAGAIKSAESA